MLFTDISNLIFFLISSVIIGYRLYLAKLYLIDKSNEIYQYEIKKNPLIFIVLLPVNVIFFGSIFVNSFYFSNSWPNSVQAGFIFLILFIVLPSCFYFWDKLHIPQFAIMTLHVSSESISLIDRRKNCVQSIDLKSKYHYETRVLNRIGNDFYENYDTKLIGLLSQNSNEIPFVIAIENGRYEKSIDIICYDGGLLQVTPENTGNSIMELVTLIFWIFVSSCLYYYTELLNISIGVPVLISTVISFVKCEKTALFKECPKSFLMDVKKHLKPQSMLSNQKAFDLLNKFDNLGWQPSQYDLDHLKKIKNRERSSR